MHVTATFCGPPQPGKLTGWEEHPFIVAVFGCNAGRVGNAASLSNYPLHRSTASGILCCLTIVLTCPCNGCCTGGGIALWVGDAAAEVPALIRSIIGDNVHLICMPGWLLVHHQLLS
jgi:hypothetical protein